MSTVIKFGLNALPPFLKSRKYSTLFVLVDENSKKHCLPLLKALLPAHQVVTIKSGERNKTLKTCEFIWEVLLKKNADRNSLILNLGGGVITDMGAFCAATFMRGIDFVNIPTSMLAMTDAAIGGKTAIDFLNYKNMIGSFTTPQLVCIDTQFLKTLPTKHLVASSSEIFKHALLQNKNETNTLLKKPFLLFSESEKLAIIKKSIRFKMSVVTLDSLDKNLRKQLNLGHTLAHALESYFMLYKKTLFHGEAVALGLIGEAYIAHRFYSLPYDLFLSIVFWYDLNFLKPNIKEINFNTMLKLMHKDKKNDPLAIKMVLLESEGHFAIDTRVTHSQIKEALKFMSDF